MPIYDCGAPDCEECQQAFGPDRAVAIALYNAREAAYAAISTAPRGKIPHDYCRVCGQLVGGGACLCS